VKTWLIIGLASLFPLGFAVIWLAVTSLLGLLSGWPTLARRYPDRDEPASVRLGGQYGHLGLVELRGALSLAACPSGLRLAMSRWLGPFNKPFFVPWDEIAAEPRKVFLGHMMRLGFGHPEVGALVIRTDVWERLRRA
jgi:hypothetical protein